MAMMPKMGDLPSFIFGFFLLFFFNKKVSTLHIRLAAAIIDDQPPNK